mgnify:CR=1 FL=1
MNDIKTQLGNTYDRSTYMEDNTVIEDSSKESTNNNNQNEIIAFDNQT